ncbi:MAG: RNA 2',3'-cyclic phosphodiesterase [Wenzhouxiangellaceae bacterium]
MANDHERMRVFFALWPGTSLRAQIATAREQLPALNGQPVPAITPSQRTVAQRSWRAVPVHNLHLTLLFLGNQTRPDITELCRRVNDLSAQRFAMQLDRFGWFARPGVLWLGGAATPPAVALVQRLRDCSDAIGLSCCRGHGSQHEWVPHMTLYRHVGQPPRLPDMTPLQWPVHEFVLLHSQPSQPYRVLRRWPLRE